MDGRAKEMHTTGADKGQRKENIKAKMGEGMTVPVASRLLRDVEDTLEGQRELLDIRPNPRGAPASPPLRGVRVSRFGLRTNLGFEGRDCFRDEKKAMRKFGYKPGEKILNEGDHQCARRLKQKEFGDPKKTKAKRRGLLVLG